MVTPPSLSPAPFARWVHELSFLREYHPDDFAQYAKLNLVGDPRANITDVIKDDIVYMMRHGRNRVYQVKGPPGSGKSQAIACALARLIDPRWRPLGSMTFTKDGTVQWARMAEHGGVCVQDEDPTRRGQGSGGVDDAMSNIEAQVARANELFFIFVNPYETGHLVQVMLDTSREEPRFTADRILYSTRANVWARDDYGSWFIVGWVEYQVPEDIMPEYQRAVMTFKRALKASGGFGIKEQVLARYSHLIPLLVKDEDFLFYLPNNRGGPTADHYEYVSSAYGIVQKEARQFVKLAWRDLSKNMLMPSREKVKPSASRLYPLGSSRRAPEGTKKK